MKVLVAGANGATGRHLTGQLLKRGHNVRAIVRSADKMPENLRDNPGLELVQGSISELTEEQIAGYVKDCDAAASCLGHNVSFKGIYCKPRRLVADSVRKICAAAAVRKGKPFKFALMNTVACSNPDLNEKLSGGHRMVIGLLRLVLPPHVDNEKAAAYLRTAIGKENERIEWVAVRPDGLIDEETVTEYDLHPSPLRSPIFNPGKTSRINVGSFMADLLTDEALWNQWKGRTPVIYNRNE